MSSSFVWKYHNSIGSYIGSNTLSASCGKRFHTQICWLLYRLRINQHKWNSSNLQAHPVENRNEFKHDQECEFTFYRWIWEWCYESGKFCNDTGPWWNINLSLTGTTPRISLQDTQTNSRRCAQRLQQTSLNSEERNYPSNMQRNEGTNAIIKSDRNSSCSCTSNTFHDYTFSTVHKIIIQV